MMMLAIWLFVGGIISSGFSESQFQTVYDHTNEGKPHLFPQGDDLSRYELGLKLCQNRDGMGVYLNVRGMLTDGDCAALYHIASSLSIGWQLNVIKTKSRLPHELSLQQQYFRYVETGSYQGLSAHIIATALDSSIGLLHSIIYSHDLFDEYIPDKEVSIIENNGFWERYMDGYESRFQKFYSNIARNGYEKVIIPISGPSSRTLKIHQNESIHMVFIDGDHTYQGALFDLYEGWRILAPGGWMLVHDCTPDPDLSTIDPNSKLEILEVRQAVRDFTRLYNLTWNIITKTMFMAAIRKPPLPETTL